MQTRRCPRSFYGEGQCVFQLSLPYIASFVEIRDVQVSQCTQITRSRRWGTPPNPRQRAVPFAASPPVSLAPAFWRLFNRPEISLERLGCVCLHRSGFKGSEYAIQLAWILDVVQHPLPEGVLHRGGHSIIRTRSKRGRLGQLIGGSARHIVRINAQSYRFVRGGSTSRFHPDLLCCGRGDKLQELARAVVIPHRKHHISTTGDRTRVGWVDSGEGEEVEIRAWLSTWELGLDEACREVTQVEHIGLWRRIIR